MTTQADANDLEMELLQQLAGGAILKASTIYAEAPSRDDIAGSDDEGAESEEEEDDDDSDSDGGGAARRAAVRATKAHEARSPWRLGRGGMLVALLALVLIGQYLALMMHLTGGR
jgi:hypothetical protein